MTPRHAIPPHVVRLAALGCPGDDLGVAPCGTPWRAVLIARGLMARDGTVTAPGLGRADLAPSSLVPPARKPTP